jgi:hypothetical protein
MRAAVRLHRRGVTRVLPKIRKFVAASAFRVGGAVACYREYLSPSRRRRHRGARLDGRGIVSYPPQAPARRPPPYARCSSWDGPTLDRFNGRGTAASQPSANGSGLSEPIWSPARPGASPPTSSAKAGSATASRGPSAPRGTGSCRPRLRRRNTHRRASARRQARGSESPRDPRPCREPACTRRSQRSRSSSSECPARKRSVV